MKPFRAPRQVIKETQEAEMDNIGRDIVGDGRLWHDMSALSLLTASQSHMNYLRSCPRPCLTLRTFWGRSKLRPVLTLRICRKHLQENSDFPREWVEVDADRTPGYNSEGGIAVIIHVHDDLADVK